MAELVALALPGGAGFVDELKRAWDQGNAVLPLDLRLPPVARTTQLRDLGAAVVVDENGERHRLESSRSVEPGDALVMATSGTTGEAKGVVLTHDAVAASARATNDGIGVMPEDRWLACLPLAHIGGLSVVTRAIHSGTPLRVLPSFDAELVEAHARKGATLVSLVPTALRRIDASLFRRILVGGAAPPDIRAPNTIATYGMTETGSGIVYDGKRLDGVELRIDEGSQLWVRSPTLLRSYRDGIDPKTPDGWFATGDAASMVDGALRILGRIAEVINTGGEKVWPAIVEAALRTHPSVDEVLIHGEPDPEWGECVVATIESRNPPSLDELREHVKLSLPAYSAPRRLEVVDALPRTSSGKVRRARLADGSVQD